MHLVFALHFEYIINMSIKVQFGLFLNQTDFHIYYLE